MSEHNEQVFMALRRKGFFVAVKFWPGGNGDPVSVTIRKPETTVEAVGTGASVSDALTDAISDGIERFNRHLSGAFPVETVAMVEPQRELLQDVPRCLN